MRTNIFVVLGVVLVAALAAFWGVAPAQNEGHDHGAHAGAGCPMQAQAGADKPAGCPTAAAEKAGGCPMEMAAAGCADGEKAVGCCPVGGCAARAEKALAALTGAEEAVRNGQDDVALEHLAVVRAQLEECRKAAANCPKAQAAGEVVNDRCPIMGGKVNPETVKPELTRTFEGQKVGFCCAGCPDQWDQLTDAQKREKLEGTQS